MVTDARRREVYWTQYILGDSGGVGRIDRPQVSAADDMALATGPRIEFPRISAASLIRQADWLIAHGYGPTENQALYLRAPDVTPSAGPKRVSR